MFKALWIVLFTLASIMIMIWLQTLPEPDKSGMPDATNKPEIIWEDGHAVPSFEIGPTKVSFVFCEENLDELVIERTDGRTLTIPMSRVLDVMEKLLADAPKITFENPDVGFYVDKNGVVSYVDETGNIGIGYTNEQPKVKLQIRD